MLTAGAFPTWCQTVKLNANQPVAGRQLDKLIGPVRRVRVETAKITIKGGNPVEEPRVVRGVTTYDIRGSRVDAVSVPGDISELPGKRQYRYDDRGNVIEMMLRGEDGTLLAKESYDYQFDTFGNWIKMTASVAVYENGKVSFEPTEVTYRTITYFYNQSVAKIAGDRDVEPSKTSAKASSSPSNEIRTLNVAERIEATPTAAPSNVKSEGTKIPESKTAGAQLQQANATAVANDSPVNGAEVTATAPTKIAAKRVSEAELRNAVLSLPQPDFPMVAEVSGRNRKVQVQVVVDENGHVSSAHGTSTEEILNNAAETAAKNAMFDPSKLSDGPTRVFSVITYDFVSVPNSSAPGNTVSSVPNASASGSTASPATSKEPATPNSRSANDGALLPLPNNSRLALAPAGAAGGSSKDSYETGVSLLNEGRFQEAEAALKEFVYRNPDNVLGYAKLGAVYLALSKNEEAVTVLKMAVKIRPDQSDAQTYYLLGVSYNVLAKYSEALTALNRAVYLSTAQLVETDSSQRREQINVFALHYNLGLSYLGLKKNREAIKEFEKSIALDPKAAEPHYALGIVQLSQGDLRSAERQVGILKPLNASLAKKLGDQITGRATLIPQRCRVFPCN